MHHLVTITTFVLANLSLLRPFTPDLELISFTNPFLHTLSDSLCTSLILDLDQTY